MPPEFNSLFARQYSYFTYTQQLQRCELSHFQVNINVGELLLLLLFLTQIKHLCGVYDKIGGLTLWSEMDA